MRSMGGTAAASTQVVGAWHTGFQVADLERSLSFYRDLLGLEEIWRRVVDNDYIRELVGYPELELHQALLRIPGTDHCLELLDYRNVERAPVDPRTANPGTAHICLIVKDLAGLYERLLEAGVEFVSPPVEPTSGPNRGRLVIYMCDWDGIRVELLQLEPANAVADGGSD
jgi:catechol 2,3-dioxygenase-like lactoylglutathione lyase family enzyme